MAAANDVLQRERPSRKARAGPSGNDRDALLVKKLKEAGYFPGLFRQDHGLRGLVVGRLGIGLIDQEPVRLGDDPPLPHDLPKTVKHSGG